MNFATSTKSKKKRPAPLSIRISDEQRERLKQMAGNMTVNAFVLWRLFGDDACKGRQRRITRDMLLLSQILANLGQSHLSPDLHTLAQSAKCGALHVTPEVEDELSQACADVAEIKSMLMQAIGIKED
jgi:hypothetical protein